MARFNSSHSSHEGAELLFEELRTFHKESREDYQHLESILEDQRNMLISHSEKLVKLTEVIEGNKGIVERLNAVEKMQEQFASKFSEIETKEKVRAAVLGVICALCSSVGGIATYLVSVYISLHK